MTSYRKAIRFFSLVLSLGLPIAASAATFDVKTLIDTDNNRGTGCSVVTPGGIVNGIDVIVTTQGTVTGAAGSVTAVTRQTCVNPVLNQFSSATAVDSGWNVGVSPIGDVTVESHMGLDVLTMDNIGTPRFVFLTSSGLSADVLLTPWSWGGGDIVMPHASRDRAVTPTLPRNILLDGGSTDWAGNVPLANGTAAPPVWRFITARAYAGLHDLFFNFQIHTNGAAPTAHDDNYSLGTLGGTLTVATLGVLNNDNPNSQPITASLVDTTQHGTLALAPNGGFVYIHDGSLASQDQFHYVAVGTTLSSNLATVTIDLPGTHPYTFTSADNVTFIDGQPNTFQVVVTGKPTPALTVTGDLPAGVTFQDNGNGTGTLSGTPGPNTSGTYALVFHADKNKPHSSSQNFTLTVTCPGVAVVNPAGNTGTVGVPFSKTFTQSGGTPPVSFTLNSGALPPGLTLNPSTGVLSGTPTANGTFPITVKVTDVGGCTAVGPTYNLTIFCNSITVTNPAVSTGTVNVVFSQTFTQAGGSGTTTFSLNSGTLPAGLTLNPSTGVLSGTPTQAGSFPITVKATDTNGCTAVGPTYNLTIGCQTITVTNPATNTGTVNIAFSQTFTAGNTIGAVTFSLNSGTLPAGITLSSGGVLSGTPTQTGSFPITVKATDANGCFGVSGTYTLTINCQVITVTNPATNTGTVNVAFSQTFTSGNAIAPVTFTLNSGSLPAGITLSSAGVLSGAPTQTGSFPITVKATDANGCFGVGATYTLTIGCQVITVTNPATTSGTVNAAFSQQFTQSSAVGGATFTLNSGTLPTGYTLSASGLLSGTTTQFGSFPITVKVTDGNGCTGIGATYNLVINCQVITVTNPATTSGVAGTAFSQTFTQSNAAGGATFSLNTGTLPTGLTLSAAGVLSGTPTQTGPFSITVKVTDGNGCTGIGGTYNLVINCQTITVTNPATTTGTAGTAFSQTFTQTGGIGATTFSIFSGTLPTGMTFHSATGVLDGTPTQTGPFSLVIRATDSNGCTGDGATYPLVIGCQTITVTNPGVTTGTAGTPFSQNFSQSGSIGGATFSLNSGTLPSGLTLSAGGVLSGTPLQTGSFPITVKVTDGNGCTGIGATYTLVIGCQTITVTNPATTTGTIQVAFSQTFTQSGAVGGATFSLNSGSLPAGLTLSSAGLLSGTPTVTGSFPITVKVTDGNGCTGVGATYNLVINCQTITVTNPATTTGTVSTPFTQTFTQAGANGTATFTTASTLPAGLTLSSAGVLSGTPTQPGPFPIVVTVTDSNGCTGTGATYNLVISCQTITVSNPATTSSPAGTPLSINFTQSGAIGTATFTTSSTLPTGLTLAANGTLSGTPSGSGAFPIVVTVTDSNSCTGTNPPYTLTITCPTITVTNPGVSSGTAGVAFSQTFTQSGGQGTVTFSIFSGTLPTGMTFHSATGVLDGTPTQTGSFPLVIRATDSNGCTGNGATYTLVIACQTITVTNPGVSSGTAGTAFSQSFTQSGAIGGATFSLNSGSLPAGLTLSAAGLLAGTPTQTGSFPITVKVTDGNGCIGVGATYTLVINCQTITVTNPSSSTGTIQVALAPASSYTFSAANTIGTVTFTINSGSLPAGVTLTSAGVLTGTPTVTGSFPITVKATDANSCFGVSSTYTLVISCQTITVTNPAATTATVGISFSDTFAQTGANGTATFTLNTGTLPNGITLAANGTLSGIPTQSGSFPITVKVTDSNACTGISPTYTLVVSCQPITVTNPATTTGTVGTAFNQTFTQSGGNGTITWSKSGAIPTGMTFHTTTGVLDGTPTQSGSFPITVTATDQNGCAGTGPTYTLVVACNVITVTNPGVTTGTVDAAFSQNFTQTGANGTATFTLNSGSLPSGLSLATTGVLSGTPTVPGSFPITVKVTDSNGCTGISATYTLVIACQTITVTAPGVTTGTVDAPFSQTFTQSGVGTHTPAVFSLNSGSLPSGLTLSNAGVLSGTPLVPGSFPITVKVTDANGCTGISATYTLVIACQTITVTNPGTSSVVFNAAMTPAANFTFTQSGVGTHTPATFTLNSGTLPSGVTLSTAGVLSGPPTQTGTFPITVKVTDANGCTGISGTYNLAITPSVGNDAYGTVNALVDNTQAYVTGGATANPGTPAVQLAGSVTANDLPAGGVSVTAGTFGTTAGGSVTIAADGTFIYTPKANPGAAATTSDSFTYTGTSNTGGTATPTSAIGTVNLTLLGRVWYVKNNGGGTNGQSQSPFTTLAAAAAASTANDIIFVYNGDGTNSGQNAGITLKDGQQLLGEIVGLTVNTHALVGAGSRPTIGNSGGAGVTVASTTGNPRGNVVIKGFSLAATTQGIAITSAGTGTLSATVDNIVVTSAGNNGVSISGAATTSTTVTVQNVTVTSATQNGIDAQQTSAGALVLNINNNTITATSIGININGGGSTSTTITNFASNNISGNTGATGINVSTATFDAVPGTVAFDTVSGGNTVIGATGNGVGASGLFLGSVKGDLSFTDLDIVTANGAGLVALSAATFNSVTGAGFQIASSGSPTIDATGGPAADLTTVTTNLPFTTIKSAGSSSTGVNLATVLGTFTAGSGSTITNATGNDFNITGGTATVTYDGTISDNSGRPVSISGATGGTKSFTGAITNSGGTGISLTSNTGATINFSGNLTLSTGANSAFLATGGGTVTATNTSSTAVTTTVAAVNIANTTIGAGGVKFLSVSSNGAANGIVLNTTGAGGFTVIGDGGGANNGSGGTIQATTAEGILLTSASNVSLGYMNITNSGTDGIGATGVNGLTINRCNVVDNAGNVTIDDGLALTNTSGALAITNSLINLARHQGITIDNNNTNMTSMTITGSSVTNTPGGDGILIQMRGTSVMTTGTIGGAGALANTISGNSATGLQVNNIDTGNITGLTILNNTISSNNGGIDLDVSPPGASLTVTVQSNTITGCNTNAFNMVTATTNTGGSMTATIRSNNIGTAGVFDSGSKIGNGIRVANGGVNTSLTIDSNTIREVPNGRGIDIEAQAYSVQHNEKVKIISNTIVRPSGTTANIGCGANVPCPQASIFILSDSNALGGFDKVCSAISGNTAYDPTSWPAGGEAAFYFARRTSASNTLQLEGTQANAKAQILATNTVTNFTAADVTDEGTSGNVAIVAAGTCGGFPP